MGLNTGMLSSAAGTAAVQELRIACTVAQQEREGGVSPRISPLAQVGPAWHASFSDTLAYARLACCPLAHQPCLSQPPTLPYLSAHAPALPARCGMRATC